MSTTNTTRHAVKHRYDAYNWHIPIKRFDLAERQITRFTKVKIRTIPRRDLRTNLRPRKKNWFLLSGKSVS